MKTKKNILLIIILFGIFASSLNLTHFSSSLNFVPISEPNASSEQYNEYASVNIYNDGYIYSYYSLSGSSIQLSGVNFDDIQQMFPQQFERFSSASWNFYPDNDDPFSQNVNLYLSFNTGDLTQARSDAEWIMGFVNAFAVTDYVEDSIYSDTYWTEIQYRGHADWTNSLDVFNNALPREYGGMAETLNISSCSQFSFQIYPSGSSIYRTFSCSWPSTRVEYLEGSFDYNFADFVPVGSLQQTNIDLSSELRFSLPNVENLWVEPSIATIQPNSWQNDWDVDFCYDVYLTLTSTPVDDFIVHFDHKFVPYELQKRENAYVEVNPYGYARKEIVIRHEYSDIINWTTHFPEIYLYSSSTYDIEREDYNVELRFRLRNLPGDDATSQALTFLNWIETNMPGGWVQTYNYNYSTSWWNGTEDIGAWYFRLQYNFTTMDETNWDLLWTDTWIFANSNMMQESDLISADSFNCYGSFRTDYGGYDYHYTTFEWNSLSRYKDPLVKTYLLEDNPYHSISAFDLFGWSSFARSEDFYRAYVSINVPVNDLDSYEFISPTSSSDGGSWAYAYTNSYEEYDQLGCYMYSYTTLPVDDLVTNFEYNFHNDSDDLIPPWGYITNGDTFSGPAAQINFTTIDDGFCDWWDEGNLDGTPHFPSTGIASVDYDIAFQALSGFHWEGSMDQYEDFKFGFIIDTMTMPDGSYSMQSAVTDNSGNTGYDWDYFQIDNYDESHSPPSIELISHNLMEDDKIRGDEILTFNISDDVGIFNSFISIGGTGWLLEEDSNPDPDLYDFNWTTEIYNEGYYTVTVTSWDMDGHEISSYYEIEVDNRPIGNPPEIVMIDPSEPDQLIENWFTFRANVTDDFMLSSVQAQIDDRVPQDMTYNDISGLYEYDYDVSTLFNGTHTFTVIVYDFDENQHTVSSSIDFFANTTNIDDLYDPPRYKNLLPGNFRSADDIVNGIVEISIEVSDDLGIQGVQLTVSEVIGFDVTSYPSNPNSVDEDDISVVLGYPISMSEGDFDGTWTTYTDSLDTSTTTDGLYLVEIVIGDIDPFSHIVTAKFLMIIHNEIDDPFGQIPGFTIEYFIGCIGISMLVGYLAINRKIKRKI
ncbi:MAG: Ig-like domain-containing protein [Promethearchaeota archaeon]